MAFSVRAVRGGAAMAVALSLVLSLSSAGPAWADDTAATTGTITGTLTAQAGGPLANAWVAAQGINEIEGAYAGTRTDSAGAYTLNGLEPGTYLVSFLFPDVPVTQYIPQQLSHNAAAAVQIVPGLTVVANDRALPMGTVSGRLTEIDGSPAARALVVFCSVSYPGFVRGDYTSADGTFRITGVPVGDYKVLVTSPDETRHQYVPGTVNEAAATVFTVTAGADTAVTDQFIVTGSVRVTATDALTGAPLATFCAELEGVGAGQRNECGDGSVTISGIPEGGGYEIWASKTGYHFGQIEGVEVVAGQTTETTVALTPRSPDEEHLPPDPG